MGYTMITTTITANQLAQRVVQTHSNPLGEEAAKLGLHHLLEVDLGSHADREAQQPIGNWRRRVTKVPWNVSEWMKYGVVAQVRKIVRAVQDGRDDKDIPPIDALRLKNLWKYECPALPLSQSLDGLRPRLLELACGYEEYCSLREFGMLHTPFQVESLIITGACELEASSESTQLAHMTTLRLHFCCGLSPFFLSPALKLRTLQVEENDAMDTITRLSNCTHVLEGLEEFILTGTNECDLSSTEYWEFLASIQKMSHLRLLQLSQRLPFTGLALDALPEFLPQTLERFRFWGAPGTITDSTQWTQRLGAKSWLPSLQEFALSLDMPEEYAARIAVRAPWERTGEHESRGQQTTTSDNVCSEITRAMVEYRPEVVIIRA
ncbi:hypothetical protein DACRYDRAFT_100622 [Dacryopinax primogenitus]|uniref:F-box domain-containing protein n=1 Tax=Dacryopinax primogenitus (strain DJM 731) TaxID=1858805 RepID=M5GB10_DACPD|nr:uncharacterized protein DACRYDRAFT_100622 [Dacryopinax primogenitus]EJU01133.1 hypothetical protein DACRYDRAFT_100622 [Dacryopinax primogenitus]